MSERLSLRAALRFAGLHALHALHALPVLAVVVSLAGCKDPAHAPRPQRPPRTATTTQPVAPAPRTVSQLSLISYNVLATPLHRAERVPPLLRLLETSKADIIALQEVAGWFLTELRAQPWTRRYAFTRFGGKVGAPGGQLIMARLPIRRSHRLLQPGRQGRVLVIAEVEVNGRIVAVATMHMESLLEDGPTRAQQLDQIFTRLRGYEAAVVLGDFNFGDGEQPDTAHLDRAYTDLWTAKRGKTAGFSWNIEVSPLAKKQSFVGEKSRRLDRILFRGTGLSAGEIRMIGDKPVSAATPQIFPSDHFGLQGVLKVAWR